MNSVTTIGVCFAVMMRDIITGDEHACSIHDTEAEANGRRDARNVVGLADTEFYVSRVTYTDDPSMPPLGESVEIDPEYEMSAADVQLTDQQWRDEFGDDE